EGLVVEAGRKQRRQQAADGAEIERQRWPAVLRGSSEVVIELLHRGTHVGREATLAAVDANQRVRFLGTGRKDAARAVVLDRAPDEMNAIGQQRRGERVAGETFQRPAVEGEAQWPGRGEAPRAGNAVGATHRLSSPAGVAGCGAPAG